MAKRLYGWQRRSAAQRFAWARLGDVTDRADVQRAFDAVVEKFGGVDIVVNSNAGAAFGRAGSAKRR